MIKFIINLFKKIYSFLCIDISLKNNKNDKIIVWEYSKKCPLTKTEKEFYQKLIKIEEKYPNYRVGFQIPLSSIVNKNSNTFQRQGELYQNIDFAIFDRYSLEVLLLIELNDETHRKNYKTIERDKKIFDIIKSSNIKLIKFWLKDNKGNVFENNTEYIINRIVKTINEKSK